MDSVHTTPATPAASSTPEPPVTGGATDTDSLEFCADGVDFDLDMGEDSVDKENAHSSSSKGLFGSRFFQNNRINLQNNYWLKVKIRFLATEHPVQNKSIKTKNYWLKNKLGLPSFFVRFFRWRGNMGFLRDLVSLPVGVGECHTAIPPRNHGEVERHGLNHALRCRP